MGVSFKIQFSLTGAIPTKSVLLCLMKDHSFLLPFLLELFWFGVKTDSKYVQQAVLVSFLILNSAFQVL